MMMYSSDQLWSECWLPTSAHGIAGGSSGLHSKIKKKEDTLL